MSRLISITLLLCFLAVSPDGRAAEVPQASPSRPADETRAASRWELGVGLGGISLPHYRGSEQRAEYAAPIPYVRYRGERLRVDREGGRYYFYDGRRLKLDVSATFNFPVDSDANTARQGMPDLDALLEIGPRLQWSLWQSEDERLRLRLGAPLRLALNLADGGSEGLFFAPYLQLRYYAGMETAFSIGPMWATEKFHDYYYQVDHAFVTAERPAYDASAGYSGWRLTLTSSQRLSRHYWWSGFVRYDALTGAAFASSPLVRQTDSVMAGLVIAYIFKPVKQYYSATD